MSEFIEHLFMIPVYLFQGSFIMIASAVAIILILLPLRMVKKSAKKLHRA